MFIFSRNKINFFKTLNMLPNTFNVKEWKSAQKGTKFHSNKELNEGQPFSSEKSGHYYTQ